MSEKMNKVEAMPTLKQIAVTLDVPVVRLSAIAKKPIPGEAYDPKSINWNAVKAFIEARLEKTGYDSVEDVLKAAESVEIVSNRKHGEEVTVLFGTTPKRKLDVKEGDYIHDKKTNETYKVLYTNDTIVVYALEVENAISQAIGNRVFNARFTLA